MDFMCSILTLMVFMYLLLFSYLFYLIISMQIIIVIDIFYIFLMAMDALNILLFFYFCHCFACLLHFLHCLQFVSIFVMHSLKIDILVADIEYFVGAAVAHKIVSYNSYLCILYIIFNNNLCHII
jgi:hypothetical protein